MTEALTSIRAILATTPARWQQMTATVPPELLARVPKAGEWSASDCLRHLVEAERYVFPVRVRKILAGEPFEAFDPDAQGARAPVADPIALAAEFARLRAASLELVDKLMPDQLDCTGRHPELGTVTLGELVNEWAGHDLMHTVQAERSLMQPFIAACGPWRSYFADHEA